MVNTNHIENQEHANEELNKLMKSYKDNETNKNLFYEERKKKMLEKSLEQIKKEEEEKKQNSQK